MRFKALTMVVALFGALPARAAAPVPVAADHAMVVSAHRLASAVGADILKQGGNVVDAAVAVGYALAVVYPAAGNLGGGGFMTLRFADGRTTFLDFREKAPQAATATMFQGPDGSVAKGATTDTWLAVGVPGTVAGLEAARQRYGSIPREKLIAPALALARDGFVLAESDTGLFRLQQEDLAKDPTAAAIFLKDGAALQAGDRLRQPQLAATLATLSREGPGAIYGGSIGQAIVAANHAGGGLFDLRDFSTYAVREFPTVTCNYRGYRIDSAPPPSSGGTTLCEILNILEGYDLTGMGFHSAAEVHVMAEAMRAGYRDRNTLLGDPDFVQNPLAHLLDKAYAAKIRAAIPEREALKAPASAGPTEGQQTTHYSVADAAGNAVSVTTTLNGWFGVRKVAGETGILMNNEMDDFTTKLGAANMFGLIQGENNAVAPGKTPLSSMSPTIVSKDGHLALVIGSPGGSRIITTVLEVIVNLVDHHMSLSEAIDAPRVHAQGMPEGILAEPFALSPDTRHILNQSGHTVTDSTPWSMAAGILTDDPALSPPRPDGHPVAPPHHYKLYGAEDDRGESGAAIGF